MKYKDIVPQDNTQVHRFIPEHKDLSYKGILIPIQIPQDQLYDADKVKYYKLLLDFYNQNAFGFGISGTLSRYNPETLLGRLLIQSNLNYAKNNAFNFYSNMLLSYGGGSFKGVLPSMSRRRTVGQLSHLTPYKIGEGAESIVIKNSPFSVGRITLTNKGQILKRNSIPNSIPNKFIGYVKEGTNRFPTFILKRVKVLDESGFNKYVNKLDKAMSKSGWKKVNDPNVYGRAYTNGTTVVDDISSGNVGLDWLRRPRIIDSNVLTVPEWLAQGYTLKNGGKINVNKE